MTAFCAGSTVSQKKNDTVCCTRWLWHTWRDFDNFWL